MIPTKKESDYISNLDFNKPLRELVPFRRVLWLNNAVKTTLSTAFITASGIVFTSYCTSSNFIGHRPDLTLLVSVILLMAGLAVILLIDKYKVKKKEEELNIIDAKHEFRNKQLLEELNTLEDSNRAELQKEAAKIAMNIIKKELEVYEGDDYNEINEE